MASESNCCGELRSGKKREARIKLVTDPTKEVTIIGSHLEEGILFEGDILIARNVEHFGTTIVGERFRWPDRTVVYDIHEKLPSPERVTRAIAHWEEKTVIRFKKRTNEKDYVLFRAGGGCSSQVGRIGGVQFITLGANCTAGNAIHEIGHTVGLWHEQSRKDRDDFITINWANVDDDYKHNFDQHVTDGDDQGDYDYGSVMHYPANAFAIDPGKPTIVPKKDGVFIGQREQLSAGDIAAVAAIYPV